MSYYIGFAILIFPILLTVPYWIPVLKLFIAEIFSISGDKRG
jgi:hypothetical protein